MIPPYFGHGPEAERYVFRALERNLGPEWTVWHSVAYSAPLSGDGSEGEIDFVCCHPRYGLVVLETKGGTLDFKDGQWFQDGRRLRMGPPEQATRNRHAFLAILCRALRTAPLPFPVAHALWFPFAERPSREPPEAAGITLYASDLPNPTPALLRVLGAMDRVCSSPLDIARLRTILSPDVAYRLGWFQRRSLAEARIAVLTQEQALAFDAFSEFPRLRVRGCAGSGKTLLALRRAFLLADQGKRVLLLCFNLLLAEHLRRLTAHLLTLRAQAVNEFLCELLGREDDGDPEFWHNLARDALPAARALAQERRYDAVIVDEGQDFSPAVWAAVKALVPEDAVFIVFYDPAQNVFQRDLSALPVFPWPEAVLSVNCRNTRAVFEALLPYAPKDAAAFPSAPPGDQPEYLSAATRQGIRARLRAVLTRLRETEGIPTTDIVLMGAHALHRMALDDILADFPGLRYFTYRKFKGLEAPVLILLDVSDTDPLWDRTARYTAISRAIHRLIVLSLTPSKRTRAERLAEIS